MEQIQSRPLGCDVEGTIVHQGPVFSVRRIDYVDAGGAEVRKEHIVHPGAVTVVPEEADGSILMVKVGRIAVRRFLLEFCAGKLEPGEAPEAAARRELEEEVGRTSGDCRPIGRYLTSPGCSDEWMHAFHASGLSEIPGSSRGRIRSSACSRRRSTRPSGPAGSWTARRSPPASFRQASSHPGSGRGTSDSSNGGRPDDLESLVASGREIPRLDQPLSWSVPLFRLGSTTFRIHAVFLALIVVVLIRAAWRTGDNTFPFGPWLAGILLASLLVVVFIHEVATLVASRRLGGDMPEIVLQPLGGLDEGVLPAGWRRQAIVGIAGPASCLAISVLALVALAVFSSGDAWPAPWNASGRFSPTLARSSWLEAVFLAGQVSLVVGAVGLLPMPPFRGRLLLEAILQPRVGRRAAGRIGFRIGVATCVLVLVAGVLAMSLPVVLVSILGAAALQRQRGRVDRRLVLGVAAAVLRQPGRSSA